MSEQQTQPLRLSANLKKNLLSVKDAYSSFWDNIKFKRGWAKPLFTKEAVDELLTEAAEIVVRIRSDLDKEDPSFKLRMVEGNAREFLWSIVYDPRKHPRQFVRGLVHATLRDADGYVEGLTEAIVDDMVEKYYGSKINDINLSNLEKQWSSISERLSSSVFNNTTLLDSLSTYEAPLRQIIHALSTIDSAIHQINKIPKAELPSEDDSMQLTTTPSPDQVQEPPEPLQESSQEPSQEPSQQPLQEPSQQLQEPSQEPQQPSQQLSQEPLQQPPQDPLQQQPLQKPSLEPPQQTPQESPQPEKSDKGSLVIERVSDDIGVIKSAIKNLAQASESLELEELYKNPTKGEKVIHDLNKKCLVYTEDLMKDLLTLDQVVCSQEERPLRKAQVNTIQGLMDDVDNIKKKLVSIHNDLQKRATKRQVEDQKRKEEEDKQKQAEIKEQQQQQQQQEPQQQQQQELENKKKVELQETDKKELGGQKRQEVENIKNMEPPYQKKKQEEDMEVEEENTQKQIEKETHILKNMWKSMKFEPEFKVKETADRFIISSLIPKMKESDIKITLGANNTLTISGYREPDAEEMNILKKQLAISKKRDITGSYYPPHEDERRHLLKLGAGRFGHFSQTYQLGDVDTEKISAGYEGGVLCVVVPKVTKPMRWQRQQNPQGRFRPPQSFFHDNDFFW